MAFKNKYLFKNNIFIKNYFSPALAPATEQQPSWLFNSATQLHFLLLFTGNAFGVAVV
jgi:hypothetical protein